MALMKVLVLHSLPLIWTLCFSFIPTFSFQTNPVLGCPSCSSSSYSSSYGSQKGNNRESEPNYLFVAQATRKEWSNINTQKHQYHVDLSTAMKSSAGGCDQETNNGKQDTVIDKTDDLIQKNAEYIHVLLDNLTKALDKWILTGAPGNKVKVYNIWKQIKRESKTEELLKKAERMILRAGMSLDDPSSPSSLSQKTSTKNIGKTTANNLEYQSSIKERKSDVKARKEWEKTFQENATTQTSNKDQRSALSSRLPKAVSQANDKKALQDTLNSNMNESDMIHDLDNDDDTGAEEQKQFNAILEKTSELVARSGSGSAFEGKTLGIGGLDDVLSQIKRRIWVPLAAPPFLLNELGINPVRGLLLYGPPGCGKTLLARTLGQILSPSRPVTVVSGPEIMDKFVGSSESNLRAVFDSPPDLYPQFLTGVKQTDQMYSRAALHVIVLDEFDAVARARGGAGGTGDQGDAGVARDSVVNQLLAKMDGVNALCVPTLVIGLTNKRTLIDPALLRSGRFEVQIEVPPPQTTEQRASILNVHMKNMFTAGRVLVKDAPEGTAAIRRLERTGYDNVLTFDETVNVLAEQCDGMSGASIAGVCRAAASRALERAVCDFTGGIDVVKDDALKETNGDCIIDQRREQVSIADCVITFEDFDRSISEIKESILELKESSE